MRTLSDNLAQLKVNLTETVHHLTQSTILVVFLASMTFWSAMLPTMSSVFDVHKVGMGGNPPARIHGHGDRGFGLDTMHEPEL